MSCTIAYSLASLAHPPRPVINGHHLLPRQFKRRLDPVDIINRLQLPGPTLILTRGAHRRQTQQPSRRRSTRM